MRVGIVGAGIGGLARAHVLRRQGTDSVVFERDESAARTAGYRLHVNEAAVGPPGHRSTWSSRPAPDP